MKSALLIHISIYSWSLIFSNHYMKIYKSFLLSWKILSLKLMFKNLKHDFLHFLGIKSNYQLYLLTNKSQKISNSRNQIIDCIHWQTNHKRYPILKSRNNKPSIQSIKINPKSWEKHNWTHIKNHILVNWDETKTIKSLKSNRCEKDQTI